MSALSRTKLMCYFILGMVPTIGTNCFFGERKKERQMK